MPALQIEYSKRLRDLMKELIKSWSDFENLNDYYIHTLIPELKTNYKDQLEKKIMNQIKNCATQLEWDNLEKIAEDIQFSLTFLPKIMQNVDHLIKNDDFSSADDFIQGYCSQGITYEYETKRSFLLNEKISYIEAKIKKNDFDKARSKLKRIEAFISESQRDEIISNLKSQQDQFVQNSKKEIDRLLGEYKFNDAKSLFFQIKEDYSEIEFENKLEQKTIEYQNLQKKKIEKEKYVEKINECLDKFDFKSADDVFFSKSFLSEQEYINLKSQKIKEYFFECYSVTSKVVLSDEQAAAIADPGKNILLKARAGSGKTTVLTYKAVSLIDSYGIKPDEILLLAFNTKAAVEIDERISKMLNISSFDTARTFHSLGMRLVNPKEGLLFDRKKEDQNQKMTAKVQQIMKKRIDKPSEIKRLYQFYKLEMIDAEKKGLFIQDESLYKYYRDLPQVTLNLQKVENRYIKYIADFLFEHGIDYELNKLRLGNNGSLFYSTFTIYRKDLKTEYVIDVWDDIGNSSQANANRKNDIETHITARRSIYHPAYNTPTKEKDSIKEQNVYLSQLGCSRQECDQYLEHSFINQGFYKEILSQEQLLENFRSNKKLIDKLSRNNTQFIQRAKKQLLRPVDVKRLIDAHQAQSEREKLFLEIASDVYEEYEKTLAQECEIDFDDLMRLASEKIETTNGNINFTVGEDPNRRSIGIKSLKWILIDEYQDFSKLFFNLIHSIRKYNPEVNLFCVGDDWQAINGFAGSDLEYFNHYEEKNPGAILRKLLTNRRSEKKIIETANRLMSGCGEGGKNLPEKNQGKIELRYINETQLDLPNRLYSDDKSYYFFKDNSNSVNILASRSLKTCVELVSQELISSTNDIESKSVYILTRTNDIFWVQQEKFRRKLIELVHSVNESFDCSKINVSTVHSAKGLQADVVIILDVCSDSFPLIHPDNALFTVFGKTIEDAIAEERRLFYVALTRAKSSLYIITERGKESPFLNCLQSNQNTSFYHY